MSELRSWALSSLGRNVRPAFSRSFSSRPFTRIREGSRTEHMNENFAWSFAGLRVSSPFVVPPGCPPPLLHHRCVGGRPVFATRGWELEDSRCVDVLLPGLHRCLPMDVTLSGCHRGNFMSMTVVGCRRHPRLGRGSPRVARMTLDVIRVPREDAV